MILIGLAARSVLAGVKRAREEVIERRKRLGMYSPVEPVCIPERSEGKDEVTTQRPRFEAGAWRTRKEGSG